MRPSELRAYFAGAWQVRRRIRDDRLGIAGRFAGTARFTPTGSGLSYEEIGRLSFGAHEGEAMQRYVFVTEGLAVPQVRFADDRPFHELDLSAGVANVAHDCGADSYRGRYRLRGKDRWTQIWSVIGPRKQFRLVTVFIRRDP